MNDVQFVDRTDTPEVRQDPNNYVVTTGFYRGTGKNRYKRNVTIPMPNYSEATAVARFLYLQGGWENPLICVQVRIGREIKNIPLDDVEHLAGQFAELMDIITR